jgi:hypothetical protein
MKFKPGTPQPAGLMLFRVVPVDLPEICDTLELKYDAAFDRLSDVRGAGSAAASVRLGGARAFARSGR